VRIGDVVLVQIDRGKQRPLIVTSHFSVNERVFVSGQILVEPGDYSCDGFRYPIPFPVGRILSRRIDGLVFLAFGEQLTEGDAIGQWTRRP
jgi:hypothetical protein